MNLEQLAQVRRDFERCWPLLAPAVGTPATDGPEHVWDDIANGRATFWPLERSALVGNRITHRTGLVSGNLWLAGGDWREIETQIDPLEAFAKAHGCDRVVFRGKRGFERTMKERGYQLLAVLMAKDLPR